MVPSVTHVINGFLEPGNSIGDNAIYAEEKHSSGRPRIRCGPEIDSEGRRDALAGDADHQQHLADDARQATSGRDTREDSAQARVKTSTKTSTKRSVFRPLARFSCFAVFAMGQGSARIFCYFAKGAKADHTGGKLPKLDVTGSIPVSRSNPGFLNWLST